MEHNTNENTEFKPEESKFYNDFIKPNLPKNKKEWVSYIMIILIVVTLGLVAVNQYMAISYKAVLILNPCQLCEDFQRDLKTNAFATGGINLSNILSNSSAG